jgi:hypothetical protein
MWKCGYFPMHKFFINILSGQGAHDAIAGQKGRSIPIPAQTYLNDQRTRFQKNGDVSSRIYRTAPL